MLKSFIAITIMILSCSVRAKSEVRKIEISPLVQTWIDENGTQFAYLPGLEEDLFKQYRLKESRGPSWQVEAIEYLENDLRIDFHESSSYWHERVDWDWFAKSCKGMEAENVEDGYSFKWRAIKPLKGPQKTVVYFVDYYTDLTEARGSCSLFEDSYLFLNKLDSNGKPIFLGLRSSNPMPKK